MFQEDGFTLIEVVVSLLVLSLVTLVVVQTHNGSISSIQSSAEKMDALYEVQNTLEAGKAECNPVNLKVPFVISETEEKILEVNGYLLQEDVVVSSQHEGSVSAKLFLPQVGDMK